MEEGKIPQKLTIKMLKFGSYSFNIRNPEPGSLCVGVAFSTSVKSEPVYGNGIDYTVALIFDKNLQKPSKQEFCAYFQSKIGSMKNFDADGWSYEFYELHGDCVLEIKTPL